jgi:hypothetical protein
VRKGKGITRTPNKVPAGFIFLFRRQIVARPKQRYQRKLQPFISIVAFPFVAFPPINFVGTHAERVRLVGGYAFPGAFKVDEPFPVISLRRTSAANIFHVGNALTV